MFPRSGSTEIVGSSASSWARRRTDAVPIRIPGSSASAPTSASRGSSRSRYAPTTRPAVSVEVMSFAECTATSIRSASSASSISFTNTPRSPICPNGLVRSRSPAVVIGTNAISWPGAADDAPRELGLGQREPRAARADADEHRGLNPAFVEPEQVPDRLGIGLAVAVGGRLLHPHGRLVQELVEDLRVTASSRSRSSSGSERELRELGGADLLGVGAQRRDRRHDLERGPPLAEPLGLLDDEPLGDLGLGAAAGERLGDDSLEVVDVVEEAAVELVHGRVDVTRDGDVDEEERAAPPRGHVCRRRSRRPARRSR